MTIVAHPQTEVNNIARERRHRLSGLGTHPILGREEAAILQFKPGGVIAKRRLASSVAPPPSSGRGVIKGFSQKSKRRLMDKLISISWDGIVPVEGQSRCAYFVTCTYPASFSKDWVDWKAHLRAFIRRVERRFEVRFILWKLEFQPKRKAPHYHLLIVLDEDVDKVHFRQWVSKAWYGCVGSGDPRHLKAGTNTRPLFRKGGKLGALTRYLSKYISKAFQTEDETGRCWGIIGHLPEGDVLVVALSWRRWCEFTRRLRRWGKRSPYVASLDANRKGFLVFGGRGELAQLLRGLWTLEVGDV